MFAAFTFAACEQAPIEEQSAIRHEVPETITVGFEGYDTRIQLNEAQKTVWTKDDLVSVFYRSNANQQWKYDGETGARTAELKRVDAGTATRDIDRVVVVYPYDENYYINPETYNVQASLPAVQNYLQNSYGNNGNIMISSSEYNQFSLKSVCGWLKLQIMGDGEKIKSIKLRGNNGEQVAGELYINSVDATSILASESGTTDDDSEAGGSLIFDDTILKEVTLDCGEGVELLPVVTSFYIAIPPQTFEKGFTVEIEDTEGYVMEQSTDKAVTIARNTILPMATFEFINPATPNTPAPSTNEIWYTATAKVEPTFDDALTFGADVVSNVWDSETKRGVISFDGDVTMIGDDAFNNCDKLTVITLPEGVTTIGQKAFYDCDGFTEFTIPDGVTSIGSQVFYSCSSLTSVTIPDSVTSIGSQAFYSCSSLTEFKGKFADGDGRILVVDGELIAFARAGITEYTIPDSVTSIGSEAFFDCDSLTSVTIPDSVTSIGSYAFYNCNSLTSVTIPDSVTSIGYKAFYSCDSLTSVTIPDSVTEIGNSAFYNCNSLKKVYCYATIPPSLSSDVFYGNASGRRIYVYEECVELYKSSWSGYKDSIYTNGKNCPDTTTIEYTTSDGNTITTSKFPIISNNYENGIGTLIVVGTITQIPASAFNGCDSLTSITMPDSVTLIGSYAFNECDSLTSVTIPDSVTTIGDRAFTDCYRLTSITIPDSVMSIGVFAFYRCYSLTSVYCKATTPPTLGGFVFDNNGSGRKIYVPAASVEAYKGATNWREYASAIVGYDFENDVVVE